MGRAELRRLIGLIAVTMVLATMGAAPSASAGCGSTWSRVPFTTSREVGWLSDVAQVSPTDAWAVGTAFDGNWRRMRDQGPLIAHWDGAMWSEVPAPTLKDWDDLEGVSGLAPDDVWAVGSRQDEGTWGQPLIEHWDGTAWTPMAAPPMELGGWLHDVAAVSPTDVWAVGGYNDDRHQRGLILHYDGSTWTVGPTIKTWDGWFNDIEVLASDDIWIGGLANRITGRQSPFFAHWDGASWTSVPSAGHDGGGEIYGIAAISPTDIWAVGERFLWRRLDPVIQHWDGTTWTKVPAPTLPPDSRGMTLTDVETTGTGGVWASGGIYWQPKPGWFTPTATLLRWDGAAWVIEPTPSPGTFSFLPALAIMDGSGVAVGGYHRNRSDKAFIASACGL